VRVRAALATATIFLASPAAAQSSRVYAGGAIAALTQTHSETEPLGGTGASGSALVGVWLTPRVAVEVEPAFGPEFSWQYSYRPGPSVSADVVSSRRDTFLSFQVRTRVGMLEPVLGVGYAHGHTTRHATLTTGATYFDDESSNDAIGVSAGLDAPLRVARHLEVFPTLRLLFVGRPRPAAPPLPQAALFDQTGTGSVALRYGVGARVRF
jgi:hypothetical protein